jgi:hypothetical protein
MDILTPAGQKTLADEESARRIFESHFPEYRYIHTPKDRPADIDAVVIHKNQITGVVETKCRYDVDLEGFNSRYQGLWLVTFDKILKGKVIADALQVPLVGFLYLAKSDVLLMNVIYRDGSFLPKMTIEETRTQKTVNGGSILRSNAYIDMGQAKVLT